MKDTAIGQRILDKLKGVRYGSYNQELGQYLCEKDFTDYVDIDNMNEFLVRAPRQLMIYKVGTCYDTANYIYHQLYRLMDEEGIQHVRMIFYEYPIENGETQTHLTSVYQMKGSDKWIHVEYSDDSNRGVHVLDSINDVFTKDPLYINWDAPVITNPIPMLDYYIMCKQNSVEKSGGSES